MKDSLAAALETVTASGMPEIIEYAFATPLGIVDLLAELSISANPGEHVRLIRRFEP